MLVASMKRFVLLNGENGKEDIGVVLHFLNAVTYSQVLIRILWSLVVEV